MRRYYYKTPIGTFSIVPDFEHGDYRLYIEGKWLGSYKSPRTAADRVHLRSTGHESWDVRRGSKFSADFEDWEME